jgi:peptidoglycan-N-acetylglucosamine deacetylase
MLEEINPKRERFITISAREFNFYRRLTLSIISSTVDLRPQPAAFGRTERRQSSMSKNLSSLVNCRRLLVSLSCLLVTLMLAAAAQYGGQTPSLPDPGFSWPTGKRGALSLSFDDARASQIDNGTPLLDRYGVKATFYVSPESVKQRLDGWKKAIEAGHEIGNHSLVHPCSGNFPWARHKALENYTLQSMERELRAANQAVEELLGVSPTTFAYPCGQTFVGRGEELASYIPLVARMFKVGRGWLGEAPNDPAFCDLAQILAIPMDDQDFEQIKPQVEQAMKDGRWLVLAGHDIAASEQRQVTRLRMLESLLQYAQNPANGVWIDTIATVASYISQHRPEKTF